MRSFAFFFLAAGAALMLTSPSSAQSTEMVVRLVRRLSDLNNAGRSCIHKDVEARICISKELIDAIRDAAEECEIDAEGVQHLDHLMPDDDINEENAEEVKIKQDCFMEKMGWCDAEGNLIHEKLQLDFSDTVMGGMAKMCDELCTEMADRCTVGSVSRFYFARTPTWNVLVPIRPNRFVPRWARPNSKYYDKAMEGVEMVKKFVYFSCMKDEIQKFCVKEANCQLKHMEERAPEGAQCKLQGELPEVPEFPEEDEETTWDEMADADWTGEEDEEEGEDDDDDGSTQPEDDGRAL